VEWKGRGREIPGKGEGKGREGEGRKERRGIEGAGRKVRTPPLSIPAYAPGLLTRLPYCQS